ncbi:unnamed protein product [Diabrotica balteata]|uniref:Gamma-interferon-inducible lysosomal thiol reductase n=1 Tax=Diabrotica balteata TaxID=107213 RepID=A0A9N9SZZ8_DIABA|nr:unnamed protein product [Diabrotica balteata]
MVDKYCSKRPFGCTIGDRKEIENQIAELLKKNLIKESYSPFAAPDADLTLTLFYEGLCPGCHQFIINQLYPSYEKLAGSLKLDLVPFGWSLLPSSVSWDKVNDCYHGERGTELLLSYEDRQAKLNPELPWVPNVRFNGVYDADIEEQAVMDLTSTVCNLLKDNKPDVCKDHVINAHPKMLKNNKC